MSVAETVDSQKQASSMQNLFSLIAPYKWRVLGISVIASISVTLCFSPHIFVWWLATTLLEENWLLDNKIMMTAVLLLVAGLAARYCLAGITSVGSHFVAFKVQSDLRQNLAEKLAAVPMGYLESQRRGKLRKLAVDDVEALEDGVAHLIPEMVASTLNPLILLIAMFAFDWRMALVAMLPIFISFVLMVYLVKRGEQSTRIYQDGLSEIGAVAQEMISAFPLVKTHRAGNIVLGRASKVFKQFKYDTDGWINKALLPSVWFQVLTTAAPVTILPAGVYFYQAGTLDMPTLLFFLIISIGLGNVFYTLGTLTHRLTNQKDTLDRIFMVLNETELSVATLPKQAKSNGIHFKNVSFAYDSQPVLKGIDLEIKEGESIALVGPSGSGKSTIARLISRFWDVSEGEILIGDVNIRNMTLEELNGRISHVFQDVFLFSQSVSDNIKLGCMDASEDDVIRAAKAAQAHEFIMELPNDYSTILNENGRNLSGGQRQRLSIARAILKDSPLLLLDEATAFADPKSELQVQLAISELTRNKTVIAIAHRLNTIVDMDRIVVLDSGGIVDQGKHEDLLKRCDLYRKLWDDSIGSSEFTLGNKQSAVINDC